MILRLAQLKFGSSSGQLVTGVKRTAERVGQKERTRQRLLEAARAIAEEGGVLTVARAAEKANVAEATAYRYYRNPRTLLRDALFIDWSGLDDLLTALVLIPRPVDRAQRAAEEMARFVLERELRIRLLFTATEQEPRDKDGIGGLPHASFRRRLVEAVLSGAETVLGADFKTIQLGLIVIISPQAVLTLRDALPLEPIEVVKELGLMSRRMFGEVKTAS